MTNDVSGHGDTPYAAVSQAIIAYFEKVNREDGGVCGRDLALVLRDDEYSPDLALSQTQALSSEDNVLAIIGALSTQSHQLVAPWLNDPDGNGDRADGIPDLFVSTGWSEWGKVGAYPWTIGFIPDYATDARVLANFITAEMPDKKVGLLYREDEFGRDYLAVLQGAFPEDKFVSQSYAIGDVDAGQEIGALADGGAQVLVLAAPPEIAALAIAAATGGGLTAPVLLSYVNQPSNLAGELGGGTTAEDIIQGFQQLDGVLLTTYLLSAVEDEQDNAILEHTRVMETYDGPMVSSLSIYGQALAETAVETLLRACPDLTRESVLTSAESLDGFHPSVLLPGINIELSRSDHESIQAMQMIRINGDGTLELVGEPINVAP